MIIGQMPLVVEARVTTGLVSQLSVAVTGFRAGKARRHWTVAGAGNPTSTGGIVSKTTFVTDALTRLVQASVAVHVCTMMVGQMPLVVETRVITRLVSQLS